MPKFKTTNREMTTESVCYAIGYADLQNVLAFHNAVAYTSGVYGWNSDIYLLQGNTYISTGYRPCGYNLKDYWIIKALDRKASYIRSYESGLKTDAKIEEIEKLFKLLCKIVSLDFHLYHQRGVWNKEEKEDFRKQYEMALSIVEDITGYNAETAYKYSH